MRTHLLCALAFLGGAAVAHAQPWPYHPTQTSYQAPASYESPSGYPLYSPGSSNALPNYQNNYPRGVQQNVTTMGQMLPAEDPSAAPQPAIPPTAPQTVIEDAADEATPVEGGPERPGPQSRYWVSVDYIMLFLQPASLNTPLVTNGSAADLHAGALDQKGTTILFANN